MKTALSVFLKIFVVPFLNLLFRLRWAYFHMHPGYTKFYMDSERKEAHFFHAKTNSVHSPYRIGHNV